MVTAVARRTATVTFRDHASNLRRQHGNRAQGPKEFRAVCRQTCSRTKRVPSRLPEHTAPVENGSLQGMQHTLPSIGRRHHLKRRMESLRQVAVPQRRPLEDVYFITPRLPARNYPALRQAEV